MITIIAVAAIIVFTGVPVVFWFKGLGPIGTPPPTPPSPIFSVYRSISCVTLGFGVTYKSAGQNSAWYLGCDPQIPNLT
jgi:hypothetical protein